MSTIVVTTASDSMTLDPNDGVITLREAIAQAAAGDTIAFAASLDNQTISLAQGLVIRRDVIIDGDRNNDGLADITLNGQANGYVLPHIAILGSETHVLIDGLNFTQGGSRTLQTGGFGTDGAYGTAAAQDGVDRPIDWNDEEEDPRFEEGGGGLPGRNGGAAPDAGDALPAGVTGGAIYNQGILALNNVQLYDNSAIGGTGGNGATGNTANGVGGDGGRGGRGSNTSSSEVGYVDLGPFGGFPLIVVDFFNASDSGNGGNGGIGATGGDGGDGGSAAGAIVNLGTLSLSNVAFMNNAARAGNGGNAGAGGMGGNGGAGGAGWHNIPLGRYVVNGGDGGDGGTGGTGGTGGRGGDSGAAAGAILNYGTVTGQGASAAFGNTVTTGTAGSGGGGGSGGAAGAGGEGGQGSESDGDNGSAGSAGAAGAHDGNGQAGAMDTFLVDADGGVSALEGSASTIVYLAIDHAAQYEGDAGNSTVFHVYVNRAGDLSHASSVEVSFGFAFPNPEFGYSVSTNQYDFAGGFPSGAGILSFAANERQKVITITVAGDTQLEGDEQFSVSLGLWSGMAPGATIQVTGTILNDDTGLPPSTGDAPVITDYQGDSRIFTENAGPIFIDSNRNSQIRDTDSPYLNGGRLTITISQNYVAGQDVLSFVQEPNGVSQQDDYLYVGAALVGRVNNTGATLTVDFSADATPALVSKILSSVTYNNSSDTPNTATRTISVTVTDGDGNVSETRTGTVSVNAVDDGPIIDLDVDNSSGATGAGYRTSYAPGSAGVALLDGDVIVTDPDGSTFEPYAIISIASPKAGDLLSIVDTLPAGIQVLHGEGFTDTTTIWLIGNGTYAQYVQALRQIRFSNTEANPDRATRDIRISLGGENSHASVVVGVAPSTPNDNNGATNGVIEGAAAGTAVGITASASDSDGNPITYSLDDDAGGRFAIHASTGVVTVSAAGASTIDYETAPGHAYGITVRASDGTGFSTTRAFSIAVANFTPPTPTDSNGPAGGSVQEGAANGTSVGITAASSEPGGVIYSLVGGDGRFTIDAATGVVTVADAALINYESATSHTITVRAADAGGAHSDDRSFTIAVTNAAPSAPVDTDGAAGGSIAENAALHDLVGIKVVAADPNGGAVTWSLANSAGGRFAITNLGVVVVANPDLIDYESNTSYTIVVRARDAAGLTADQSFTIAVTDVAPTTPVDTDGTSGTTIDEGLGAGALVGITASSSDVHGGTVSYSLTDDAGGLFAIDATTGVVAVASGVTINQDGAPSWDYSITVKASAGSLFASQTFTVTVNNVAPATPADSNGAADTVSEGAADGDSVGLTLTSTDPGGATLTWSLINDLHGRFAIDGNGFVTVADASLIDYEGSGGSYTIVGQVSDGSLTSTQSFTITVTNVAPASAGDSYTIDEDGTLTVAAPGMLGNDSDVNGGALTATLQDGPLHAANFVLNADGSFSYTPVADYNGADSFTYRPNDGTAAGTAVTVAITVNAVNDAPEVAGPVVLAAIAEDSSRLITQDDLLGAASDVDGPMLEARNLAVLAGAGLLTDHHDGTWTYTPALNDDSAVNFSYQVTDGVADPVVATATLDITPANDAPAGASGAPSAGAVATEQVATVIDSTIIVTDPDNTTLPAGTVAITGNLAEDVLAFLNTDSTVFGNIAAAYAAASGVLSLTSAGATATLAQWQAALRAVTYTNTADAPHVAGRTIDFVLDDGTATSTVATAIIGVATINDAPLHALPDAQSVDANHTLAITGLSVADPDAGSGTLTTTLAVAHGILTVGSGATVSGSGTAALTLTGTVTGINATLSNVSYTPTHDFFGYDTLTITTNDGGNAGNGGALADTDQLAIKVGALATGSTANEDYAAPAGNQKIDAGEGNDAITFNFKLTDATIRHVGNTVVIDGPGSHTVLSGFETFRFADGTVDNKDGEPLVDDLFYYSRHHDVWAAQLDADAHYHAAGWQQGFDPNAFFSTTIYLSANPDVKAAGLDPLGHFHQVGWAEGRVASPAFDTRLYLAANPDVAGDPLAHFLQFGYQENRQPVAATELIAANGFDYVWYLNHNADVAAANVDPFAHFMTVGWTEGRNPNALFDVTGYLGTYADVAAAHVNPLTHYNEFGRHEGRDPSAGFDTTLYLAAYPDVAASHVNPLTHFLQFGIHEGRSPFADGVWG